LPVRLGRMDVDDWTVDVQNLDFGREPTNRQRPTNWQLRTLANFIELHEIQNGCCLRNGRLSS
jgi:hypothetical protein